ncbi:MAG: hypothetical protein HYV63_16270 [Candidatus Schekmanbacteria bacterium]|nr:hypothetical protein [Candidatus Schekmanbacteria bacterium]
MTIRPLSWWVSATIGICSAALGSSCGGGGGGGGSTPPLAPLRSADWVTVRGDQLTAYRDAMPGDSAPRAAAEPGELRAYAWRQGAFQAIPFQIDEKSAGDQWVYRTYPGEVDADTGIDDNDELVVAAKDLGERAPATAWLNDADARRYPRAEVEVTDPLQPGLQRFAYLFRTTTGALSPDDYVAHVGASGFNTSPPQVRGLGYELGFNHSYRDSLYDYLRILAAGPTDTTSPDLLDKMKAKGEAKVKDPVFGTWVQVTFNEGLPAISVSLTGLIDGPIRVVERSERHILLTLLGQPLLDTTVEAEALYYPWSVRIPLAFDPSEIGGALPAGVKDVLVSGTIDLAPTAVGMRFSNAHVSGVPIDGKPDSVPRDLSSWSAIEGSNGRLVVVGNYGSFAGVSFCYVDDSSGNAQHCVARAKDTGDGMSYGEAGLLIDVAAFLADPATEAADLTQTLWLLGPDSTETGETLLRHQQQPLVASTAISTL